MWEVIEGGESRGAGGILANWMQKKTLLLFFVNLIYTRDVSGKALGRGDELLIGLARTSGKRIP